MPWRFPSRQRSDRRALPAARQARSACRAAQLITAARLVPQLRHAGSDGCQLPGAAMYSRWRPTADGQDRLLQDASAATLGGLRVARQQLVRATHAHATVWLARAASLDPPSATA